jgi:tetratricopeptide (TPR) repeat protein
VRTRRLALRRLAGGLALALCAAAPSDAERFESAALNFAFDAPTAGWVRAKPEMHDAAQIMLVRGNPPMRFHIIGHDTQAPADVGDEEQLIRALDAFEVYERFAPGTQIVPLSSRKRVIAGVPGMQITNRVTQGERIHYEVNWIGARAGINYWMNVTSDSPTVDRVALESRELFERFSLIDPQRTVSARAVATRFRSERFGYAIDLTGTGLMEGDPAIRPPRFEFLATVPGHGQGTGELATISVFLGDLRADPELVDVALCTTTQPDVRNWKASGTHDVGGVRIREYDGSVVDGGRAYSFRVRVFQRAGYAISVVSRASGSPQWVRSLLDAGAKLQLDPAAPARPPDPLAPGERERFVLFLNQLAVVYVHAGRAGESVRFLERAVSLGGDQPVYATNLVEALLRAGRARDAARAADKGLARFPDDPRLIGFRAIARAAQGERVRAANDYRRAYELGNRLDDVIAGYVLALVDQGEFDAALAALDQRMREPNAFGARLMRTAVLRRAGRREEATSELQALLKERPGDWVTQGAMVDAAIADGDPAAFLAASEPFVEPDRSGAILYLRALALSRLGRKDEAIAAVERALVLAPDSLMLRALRERLAGASPHPSGRGT